MSGDHGHADHRSADRRRLALTLVLVLVYMVAEVVGGILTNSLALLADTLGSVQAIGAGALIWAFGWSWVDPLASLLIAGLVVWSSWALLKEAVNVLLEGVPGHLDTRDIERTILDVAGVAEIHDLHVWTITSGFIALSVHVVPDEGAGDNLLWTIRDRLRTSYDIEHTTVQIEPPRPSSPLPVTQPTPSR